MSFTYKWNLSDLENVEKNGLKVFSCFAGGGGSSQGYKMAGYDVIGCNEIDPRQMEIYLHNLKPKFSYLEDIRTFRMRDDLPKELYELDILDASFPCSLFSSANLKADDKKGKEVKFREGQAKQTLDDLAFETIHLVDKLRPRVVVFENVKGLLHEKNKWYVEQIYSQFHNIGYAITHKLINCADCGVPQKRERVFFIAVRNDLNFDTIDLFGCEPKINFDFKHKHITFKEVYIPNSGRKIPKGLIKIWEKRRIGDVNMSCTNGRENNKPNSLFSQNYIYMDSVSNTLTAKEDGCVLFDEPRYYCKEERILIQSWSMDYDFKDQSEWYVLGMSVPPLAMYRISKRIKEYILDKN